MTGRGLDMWRKSQCCDGPRGDVVRVDIFGDGSTIGLMGLTEIFEQLYLLGRAPDASAQDELVKMVAAKNYVPRTAEALYGAALVREYAIFCAQKKQSEVMP
jgi:hypothetical protein